MLTETSAVQIAPSLMAALEEVATECGTDIDSLVHMAISEKLASMRPDDYLALRARHANPARARTILARLGVGNPPVDGDERDGEFR